jgi:hypothetical protein
MKIQPTKALAALAWGVVAAGVLAAPAAALNPQPLPPGIRHLQPQPLPPRITNLKLNYSVMLNPQPLPPGIRHLQPQPLPPR